MEIKKSRKVTTGGKIRDIKRNRDKEIQRETEVRSIERKL
jgi:hypothetical protein